MLMYYVNATKPRDNCKLINFHNKKAKITKGHALHALQLQDPLLIPS